jgi:hypothetical protein
VAEVVTPDEYPTWVPAPVVEEAESLLAEAESDEEKELTRRLLVDPRMEGVWRDLANPNGSRASSAARENWARGAVTDGWSDQDVALAVFFRCAQRYAQHDVRPLNVAMWKAGHQRRLQWAKGLGQEAMLLKLQWFEDPEAEGHVAAILEAARFFENREMELFRNPPRSMIGRNQGDPFQRRYAVLMAGEAGRLFGEPKYVTIATVTNVALVNPGKSQVTKAKVWDWWKASVRVKRSFLAREF